MNIKQILPFTQAANNVIDDLSLGAMEILTYLAICRFANKDKECFPSLKKNI